MTEQEKRERLRQRKAAYRERNREKIRQADQAYRERNIEAVRERQRERLAAKRKADPDWHEKQKAYMREYSRTHYNGTVVRAERKYSSRKERYSNDENYRQRQRIHSDMWKLTRGVIKSGRMFVLLGCTLDEFSRYIEAKFEEGMNFDNLGEWEVDHIRPLASFDLTDDKQRAEACHYTNTRPRWKRDNRGSVAKV